LDAGSDAKIEDYSGRTAFVWAFERKKKKTLRLFFDRGLEDAVSVLPYLSNYGEKGLMSLPLLNSQSHHQRLHRRKRHDGVRSFLENKLLHSHLLKEKVEDTHHAENKFLADPCKRKQRAKREWRGELKNLRLEDLVGPEEGEVEDDLSSSDDDSNHVAATKEGTRHQHSSAFILCWFAGRPTLIEK